MVLNSFEKKTVHFEIFLTTISFRSLARKCFCCKNIEVPFYESYETETLLERFCAFVRYFSGIERLLDTMQDSVGTFFSVVNDILFLCSTEEIE